MPSRWIAFDTEATSTRNGDEEIQTWAMGALVSWRTDLRTGDHAEIHTFTDPIEMWRYVSGFCRKGYRTVAVAHNLGYDVRISQALIILPTLGFELEWCNLDANVSAMTWRSDHGTLVFMDTFTWLPLDLNTIAPSVGLQKLAMPANNAPLIRWREYCTRDAEIVYRCVSDLNRYISAEALGNWQPTGAGMAYATWRHRFMNTKILVHDDVDALTAERAAMHTGRAEAWKHGEILLGPYTEVDLRNAYTTIAAQCEMPVKLKMHTGAITNAQYDALALMYRVLARVQVTTSEPVAPYRMSDKTIWPVGTYQEWYWDTEIDAIRKSGGTVKVCETYTYTRGPILAQWATWILSVLRTDDETVSPVVRTWLKHCARAFLGRIALRCPQWDLFGENPGDYCGITHETNVHTGKTTRMLHIGSKTFIETEKAEGRDSLPQVTGWIMAECRARLWHAIIMAGYQNVVHVDTDSLIVNDAGLRRLKVAYGDTWHATWQPKASYRRMIVYGPRNYRGDASRRAAGVPGKAQERLPNLFHGERWHGLASDLTDGRHGAVTIETATWEVTKADPRRQDAPGVSSGTMPYQVDAGVAVSVSSSSHSGDGA